MPWYPGLLTGGDGRAPKPLAESQRNVRVDGNDFNQRDVVSMCVLFCSPMIAVLLGVSKGPVPIIMAKLFGDCWRRG